MRSPNARLVLLAACAALPAACSGGSVDQAARSVASQAPALFQDGLVHATLRAKIAALDVDAATSVGIAVREGHVTLTGTVRSAKVRSELVSTAKSIKGVSTVDDELRVDPNMRGAADKAGDFALSAKVTAALAAQTGVNAISVKASAKDGVVTLRGDVPSDAIKSTMLSTTRKMPGVRTVVDGIAVKP
ncbi:MAG TPA: BON domain-containing protein [Candidatus Binatia bacterium]|nr:BON domain-containing protein [Candidatus Binatia bacterium]